MGEKKAFLVVLILRIFIYITKRTRSLFFTEIMRVDQKLIHSPSIEVESYITVTSAMKTEDYFP